METALNMLFQRKDLTDLEIGSHTHLPMIIGY